MYLFVVGWAGLPCCAQALSSRGQQGLLSVVVRAVCCTCMCLLWWLLLLQSTGLGCAGSVLVVHGLSCSWPRGICPDQGSNLCPLYWQADSYPLYCQGSPRRYSQILIPKQMCIFKYCTWKVGGWGWYLFKLHFFLLQYRGNNDPQCFEMGFCRNAHLLR